MIINHEYDDGQWHRVVIQNIKKKVTLTIDGQSVNGKVPKKINVANMVYIGGVPVNRSHLPDSLVICLTITFSLHIWWTKVRLNLSRSF